MIIFQHQQFNVLHIFAVFSHFIWKPVADLYHRKVCVFQLLFCLGSASYLALNIPDYDHLVHHETCLQLISQLFGVDLTYSVAECHVQIMLIQRHVLHDPRWHQYFSTNSCLRWCNHCNIVHVYTFSYAYLCLLWSLTPWLLRMNWSWMCMMHAHKYFTFEHYLALCKTKSVTRCHIVMKD